MLNGRVRWVGAIAAMLVAGLTLATPAHGVSTGCITYVDYIYQADKSSENQVGNGYSLTTSAAASSSNDILQHRSRDSS